MPVRTSVVVRRAVSLLVVVLAFAPMTARAQLAPMGGNAAGRASDTGYTGGVIDSGGGYGASVPLEVAPSRHVLAVPVGIRYIGRGMGSAGLGWDVPISYVRRERTLAGQRPKGNPSVDGRDGVEADPEAPERVFVVLNGQRMDMVPKEAGVWVPRFGGPQLKLRDEGDFWE